MLGGGVCTQTQNPRILNLIIDRHGQSAARGKRKSNAIQPVLHKARPTAANLPRKKNTKILLILIMLDVHVELHCEIFSLD